MFPVAIDDFSVSGDLLTQRVNALMTLMGFPRYPYDNEDDEHLSDHVYDDLASGVPLVCRHQEGAGRQERHIYLEHRHLA